jgi:hypothetical protein
LWEKADFASAATFPAAPPMATAVSLRIVSSVWGTAAGSGAAACFFMQSAVQSNGHIGIGLVNPCGFPYV